jgi:hypothetical protein
VTEQRGEWQDPTTKQDNEYLARMKEFFAPEQAPEKPRAQPATPQAAPSPAGSALTPKPDASPKKLGLVLVGVGAVMALALAWWVYSSFSGGRSGGGEEAPAEAQRPAAPTAVAAEVVEAPAPKETGIVFEKPDAPKGADGPYSLKVGQYTWSGEKSVDGNVEQIVLEGRTAAHFTTAVRLTEGEITTGVFGRAEPNKPLWHATFQRTTTSGQEHTMGTYQAIDGGRVILEGAYTDRVVQDNPKDEPDVIERTYVEADPREAPTPDRYAVTFRAPPNTPIPWLVGWTPPEPVEDEGGA